MMNAEAATIIRAIPMMLSAYALLAKASTISQRRWLLKPTRWRGGLYVIGRWAMLTWTWVHRHSMAAFMTTTVAKMTVTITPGQLIWTLTGGNGISNYRCPATTIHSRILHP